jgi:hypothetical protein
MIYHHYLYAIGLRSNQFVLSIQMMIGMGFMTGRNLFIEAYRLPYEIKETRSIITTGFLVYDMPRSSNAQDITLSM